MQFNVRDILLDHLAEELVANPNGHLSANNAKEKLPRSTQEPIHGRKSNKQLNNALEFATFVVNDRVDDLPVQAWEPQADGRCGEQTGDSKNNEGQVRVCKCSRTPNVRSSVDCFDCFDALVTAHLLFIVARAAKG